MPAFARSLVRFFRACARWSLLACLPAAAFAATFQNPILAGFKPDPSIVRVGPDYYLVNSSFEYFPALPIHHSRDLVNWELVGYAVNSPDGLGLQDAPSSGGVQAATLRYHGGRFYIVATSIVDNRPVSFVTTAPNPAGPWSPPKVLAGAEGIDPSLFFDDDGRAWYTANRLPEKSAFAGEAEIWLQEFDTERLELVGPVTALWRGCCQGIWVEGPHLYKHAGQYVLLVAEGGTGLEHAVSVAVARDIRGPYRNNPRNPVLTHRQLSHDYPVVGVGHADLVDTPDGRWFAVALGWRPLAGGHALMGRETFLVPVTWEKEPEAWKQDPMTVPVFAPQTGKVELVAPLPFAGKPQQQVNAWVDEFDQPTLHSRWRWRRAPAAPFHRLLSGELRLAPQPTAMADRTRYSFIGVPQQHSSFSATTTLRFSPAPGEEAGLVVIQKEGAAFSLTLHGGAAGPEWRLSQWEGEQRRELATETVTEPRTVHAAPGVVQLRARLDGLELHFEVSGDGRHWRAIGPRLDARALSPAALSGFNYTGVHVGLYASANGRATQNEAVFLRFAYTALGD
jgi:alpha-N-arabinofuranosidase